MSSPRLGAPLPAQANSLPEISIVVGSVNSARSIARTLSALGGACHGLNAEIVVVDASTDGTTARIEAGLPVVVRSLEPGTLTPKLWSTGFALSRGRVVAFTTGHCLVGEGWARALLAAIEGGAAGAAGCIDLDPESDPVDWAVFYLRYSAFIGAGARDVETSPEIPGDNAAYAREALDRHASSFADGFWEVDFHRRLRAEDAATRLVFVPGAQARFGPSDSFASLARQRFSHGRHSGAWRTTTGVRSAWQIVLAAPLVPALLTLRIARRVLPRAAHRMRFVRSLPAMLGLAAAWAAGEAWGALSHSDHAALRKPRFAA